MTKPGLVLALAVAMAGSAWAAPQQAEVRVAFEKFVAAQNAHDAAGVEALLSSSETFLWITRGNLVWGRAQAMARFKALYAGTWQLEPDMTGFRVVAATDRAVEIFVPIQFTIGGAGEAPQKTLFYMNQVLVKEGDGWKIASILPIPVPPPAK